MIIIVRLALNLGSGCNFQVSIGFMDNIIEEVTGSEYKYGFVTNVETDTIGKGSETEGDEELGRGRSGIEGYFR